MRKACTVLRIAQGLEGWHRGQKTRGLPCGKCFPKDDESDKIRRRTPCSPIAGSRTMLHRGEPILYVVVVAVHFRTRHASVMLSRTYLSTFPRFCARLLESVREPSCLFWCFHEADPQVNIFDETTPGKRS